MLARDIMTTPIELVNRRSTLREAAQKMADLNVGALPVADRSTLVGMVTDRDITIRGVALGLDPSTATVDEVMTPGVVECLESAEIHYVVDLMEQHGLRRIVVVSGRGKPIGIISVDDLAHRAPDKQLVSEALHRLANDKALVLKTQAH